MNYKKIINQAKTSRFGLWKLNMGLFYIIPFNKPHGIKIYNLNDNSIETLIPYKRKNFNHIRGIHACALATCAEFASGFLLLTRLDQQKYRLIMQDIDMTYHYQAKSEVIAKFSMTDNWLDTNILTPLSTEDFVYVKCEIELFDKDNNHVATGHTNWQIKDWKKVNTRV